MPKITIARHLRRYRDIPDGFIVDGRTVAEMLQNLEQHFPGLSDYVVDDRGALRQHVNIFLGDRPVHDRRSLTDPVDAQTHVSIFQALSGG
jgi:molybdopterin converting factor small subunit